MATFTTYYNLAKPAVNSPTDEDLWGDELNDNMDIIDQTLHDIATAGGGGGVPIGTVTSYAGSTAPTGWLLCYGQAISRSTYSDLFTVVGTTYGSGDGSTTFNLPDCRGRTHAGKDNMGGTSASRITTGGSGIDGVTLGAAGGAQTHTLTTAQIEAHAHTITVNNANVNATFYGTTAGGLGAQVPEYLKAQTTSGGTIDWLAADNSASIQRTYTTAGTHTHTATAANTGSGQAHNNTQPTIIFNTIIKAEV